MKWLRHLYVLLLHLYPPGFREAFGEEMTAIFADVIAQAGKRGSLSLAMVCLRETRDWPGAVWQEHLLARRNTMTIQDENEPLRRGELLAALALFLFIPLAYFLVGVVERPPQWLDYVLAFVFFGGLMAAFILSITRGLPRWSPPYLGFVLMIGIIFSQYDRMWGWIYPYYIRSFGPRSLWSIPVRITYVGVFEFIMLFSILLSTLILVNLLRLLPYTRGVWQRIRADWTQLSFVLYGGLVFGILIAFDEYRHAELWKLIAWACLALGAWLYLQAKGQKQRILALIGGTTGAMWIVALAKWTLIPLQMWPTGYPDAPSETTRWVETSSSIVGWGWILLMLIVPALLNLLPSSPPATVQEDMAPA